MPRPDAKDLTLGGEPADAALDELVGQFADPWAFVRELIQNSLDAGSVGIELRVRYAKGTIHIDLVDDGDGMDRALIEGYLLTLFRSSKEDDKTKIGKFGIGFVSLFAIEPDEVVVDTGRDGIWHRVVFDREQSWTLHRLEDAYEGTTVSVRKRVGKKRAQEMARSAHDAAVRWCRHAEADIQVSVEGLPDSYLPTSIRAPFAVQAPVTVTLVEDGVEAVLGPWPTPKGKATFLNHGLTLWEGEIDEVPGVVFLAKGRHLEHTLTRDDVKRDRHFRHVVDRVLATTDRLRDAILVELERAAGSGDLERMHGLAERLSSRVPWTWPSDRPVLPAVGRGPVTFDELVGTGAWLRRLVGGFELPWLSALGTPRLLYGDPDDPLVAAVAKERTVLAARGESIAHVAWAAAVLDGGFFPATERFTWMEALEGPPELVARLQRANAAAERAGLPQRLHLGRLHGGSATPEPLAHARRAPAGVEERVEGVARPGPAVCVDPDHPLVRQLLHVEERLAALLLFRAALAASGHVVAPTEALFAAFGVPA